MYFYSGVITGKSRYIGNSSETTELIANVSAFYKAARSNHSDSVDE